MRTSDMIKSKWWRAADLEGKPPVILTIADVTEELMGRGKDQDMKAVLWFMDHPKGLRVNKTIANTMEAAYGPESNYWTGKKVKLSFDPTVEFGGRRIGGVRLDTPRGIVYQGVPASSAAWDSSGDPAPEKGPNGTWILPGQPGHSRYQSPQSTAEPQPEKVNGLWVLPGQPGHSTYGMPAAEPVPVRVNGQWILPGQPGYPSSQAPSADAAFDQSTGEIRQPVRERAPTISERVNGWHPAAGSAADDGFGPLPPLTHAGTADFDDDIPFS